jgi:uncharacterized membrane protein YhaH (DUF805 family)
VLTEIYGVSAGSVGLYLIPLIITGLLFRDGTLTATTQTIAWCVIFFFASAGASAAYLAVSEIFPMETRAMAIAFFYMTGGSQRSTKYAPLPCPLEKNRLVTVFLRV